MKKKLIDIVIALAIVISIVSIFYEKEVETVEVEYVVKKGDTLDRILTNIVSHKHDYRKYVYDTCLRNGIQNARIYPGDKIILVLPKEEE